MSSEHSEKSEAFATALGLFLASKEVEAFLRETILPELPPEKVANDRASALLFGQLLRAFGWTRTITKLNEPFDFQAVAAAARALFETAIDMVLLYASPADAEQVEAWEKSARFKHAEAVERYYRGLSVEPPEAHEPIVRSAANDRERVEQLRLKYGWKKHPDRWTGKNLGEDAKRADQCGHEFKFSSFYETEYRQVCWMVHGSAFVHRGVRAEHFPGIGGLLYQPCGDLATLCAELAVRRVLGWTEAREKQFAALKVRRIWVAAVNRRCALGEPPFPDVPAPEGNAGS